MSEGFDLDRWRREFPVARDVIHLNHAARAPLSGPARRAMEEAIRELNEDSPRRFGPRHAQAAESVRQAAGRLVGATANEIGFVANTAQGMSILANGLQWRSGDNVCVPEGDYPANVYPWLNLATRGVEVRFVPAPDGAIDANALLARMDARTRVVSVSSVEFRYGYRNDLAALAEICRARGAILSVDAIQQLGAAPLDVGALGVDFLGAGGFKWLLGPIGSGFLFCSNRILDQVHPPNVGADSVANSGNYLEYDLTPAPGARRYEEGSRSEVAIIGLGASIEMFLEIGLARIEETIQGLLERATAGLARMGYGIRTPGHPRHRAGILTFSCRHEEKWYRQRLARAGIVATVRYGEVRIAPHFYTPPEGIDTFLEALR